MTGVNIYFYRGGNTQNVLDSWGGCTAVPHVGDTIQLSTAPDAADWTVVRVFWSKPEPQAIGPQVVDIFVRPTRKAFLTN